MRSCARARASAYVTFEKSRAIASPSLAAMVATKAPLASRRGCAVASCSESATPLARALRLALARGRRGHHRAQVLGVLGHRLGGPAIRRARIAGEPRCG